MRGHIRQRGKKSWELKFDAGRDPVTGERNIQYYSFRGTKREAQDKLSELLASIGKGEYVEPSKVTVAALIDTRITQWVASGNLGRRSAERYRSLSETVIAPHIGAVPIQKLRPADVERWHTTLHTSGRRKRPGASARARSGRRTPS